MNATVRFLGLFCAALVLGSAGCDDRGPVFTEVQVVSDTNNETGPYEVLATLKDRSGIDSFRLFYRAGEGLFDETVMRAVSDEDAAERPRYFGQIPGFPIGSVVTWGLEACDTRAACTTSPETFPTVFHRFVVGTDPSVPRIDSVVPDEGPESGGTRVVIDGADFRPGARVFFDDTEALTTEWIRLDRVAAQTPPHPVGLVAVRVQNPDDVSATLPDAFTFTPAPAVLSLTPTEGPAAGGTVVVVVGENFGDQTRIFFDDVPCRNAIQLSESEIQCETPPGTAGLVDVDARDADGAGSGLPDAFMYLAPPDIELVSPDRGPDLGGTEIIITGDDLIEGALVFVGDALCDDIVYGTDAEGRVQITCTVPEADPGIVDVTVQNPDGQTDVFIGAFNYLGPPVLIQVIPSRGPVAGGTEVNIIGAGLSEDMVVRFGDALAEVVDVPSDLQLVVLVPPTSLPLTPVPTNGLGPVDVSVTNVGPIDFRSVTLTDGFSYVWPPEVDFVTPPSGSTEGGTEIVISGRFYFDLGEPFVVLIGENECLDVVVVSPSTITCTTPPGEEGFVDVTVQNAETSSGVGIDAYEYIPPPEVIEVRPPTGPTFGGETVEIIGDNFRPGAVVFIDGIVCTNVMFLDAMTLTCITPPHAAGFVDVRVVNPDGQEDTGEALYEYLPVAVDPEFGLQAGFTRVRIRAGGIDPNATIRFDNTIATDCTWQSSTEVICQTPPHGVGVVDVTFTNPNGTGDTGEAVFAYREYGIDTRLEDEGAGFNGNHISLADLNGNGQLDVAVANGLPDASQVDHIYFNTGVATYQRSTLPGGALTSNAIRARDFNGDAFTDLIVATSQTPGAIIYRHPGTAPGGIVTFTQVGIPQTPSSLLAGAFDAELIDLVGDARPDLFVLTIGCSNGESGDCDVFEEGADGFFERTGDGDTSFTDRSASVPHDLGLVHDHKIAAPDLDGDGDNDLVLFVDNFNFGADGNRHRILYNRFDEGAGFEEDDAPFVGLVGDVFGVDHGDITGDNQPDVIAASCEPVFESSEVVYVNQSGSLVRSFNALPVEQSDCDIGVHLFDADNDGDLEIWYTGARAGSFHNKIYVNRGDGTFVESPLPSLDSFGTFGADAAAGDLDEDGAADVVVAANGLGGGAPRLLIFFLEAP